MSIPVPETFNDIDTTWFDAALREGGVLDVDIASVRVEPMHPDKGLIGDIAVVHAAYLRGSGPASFVVKLPAANADSRRIGEMLRAYGREVAFYRLVAPQASQTRLPQCYYSGQDEAAGRWAIVLEAIEADEFDAVAGATTSQATSAVDALADFHAAWWESSTVFDWMPGFDVNDLGGLQALWLTNLPVFVERYHHVLPGPTAEWVLAFAPKLTEWASAAATEPLTMVHSDYSIDNLLFRDDQVTIIDWQTTMRAPAAMDLSCFIATSLATDVRRRDESALIDRYLDRLDYRGVTVERDWFLRSYDENLLWWMGQFGNNLAHLHPADDSAQAALTEMVKRVYTTALDRDLGRLI